MNMLMLKSLRSLREVRGGVLPEVGRLRYER